MDFGLWTLNCLGTDRRTDGRTDGRTDLTNIVPLLFVEVKHLPLFATEPYNQYGLNELSSSLVSI
jgi:hypothetical protein